METEDQLTAQAAQIIADEIDFELLKSILVSNCGWHYVALESLQSNERAINISEWAHTECKGHWRHLGRMWLFEKSEDAILFKLTWS